MKYKAYRFSPKFCEIIAELHRRNFTPKISIIFSTVNSDSEPITQATCEAECEMMFHVECQGDRLSFCFSEPNGGSATKPIPFSSLDEAIALWDKCILTYCNDELYETGLEWFSFA